MRKSNVPYLMSGMILVGGLSIQPTFNVVNSWYVLTTLAAFLLGFMQTRAVNPRSIISLKATITLLSFILYAVQAILLEHGVLLQLLNLVTSDENVLLVGSIVFGLLYLLVGLSVFPIARFELKKRFR